VISEAKLFAIVFQGNSRPAFFGSKSGAIASRWRNAQTFQRRRAMFPVNLSGASKFPSASKLHRVKLRAAET
jgi:hypothetical protein